jgi:hypothetical protein
MIFTSPVALAARIGGNRLGSVGVESYNRCCGTVTTFRFVRSFGYCAPRFGLCVWVVGRNAPRGASRVLWEGTQPDAVDGGMAVRFQSNALAPPPLSFAFGKGSPLTRIWLRSSPTSSSWWAASERRCASTGPKHRAQVRVRTEITPLYSVDLGEHLSGATAVGACWLSVLALHSRAVIQECRTRRY